jgi:hypothetical protein
VLRRIIDFPLHDVPVLKEPTKSKTKSHVYWLCLAPASPRPANFAKLQPKPSYAFANYTGMHLLDNPTPGTPTQTNYRIIWQPRLMAGEQPLQLPANVGIDFGAPGWNSGFTANNQLSTPPQSPAQARDGATYHDIVFAPSGVVMNSSTSMIFLWVRNLQRRNTADRLTGKPVLVTIQTRTGFVSMHPVAPSGDPYQFARDGRSSGM